MIILYKVCFGQRVNDDDYERISSSASSPSCRPIAKNISEMVTVCLTSLVQQMTEEDLIVFFLDGADKNNIIDSVCKKNNINYTIKQFNHECAVKINNETVLYIENEIKNRDEIIYLCEDDYLHYNNCLDRMKDFLNTYPNYFCHPIDYPNLYDKETHCGPKAFSQASEIIVTKDWHWRRIKSTTMTFAFKKHMYSKYRKVFQSMTTTLFWEHLYNIMYIFDECYSPIPSLTSHLENNCLPHCIDTKKIYGTIMHGMDRGNLSIAEWIKLYADGGYDGVGSGPGSTLENNYKLITWLIEFLTTENISCMLDLGCGDMQWMPKVLENVSIQYTGIDGVPELIKTNTNTFLNLNFKCANIVEDIPCSSTPDLIFIKDILQHFNLKNVKTLIRKINNINPTHSIIITPWDVESDVEDFLFTEGYKLVYKYLADEVKHIFIKKPFTSTYVLKTCSDIYN